LRRHVLDGASVLDVLDRVWITRQGRAKLLDFRAPGAPEIAAKVSCVPAKSAQTFLSDVASCALSGRLRDLKERTETDRPPRHTLPVSACALLDALDRGQLANWAEVVEGTRALMKGADRVQRGRRVATLALCAAWALWVLFTYAAQTSIREYALGDRLTEVQELSDALWELRPNTGRGLDRALFEDVARESPDTRPASNTNANRSTAATDSALVHPISNLSQHAVKCVAFDRIQILQDPLEVFAPFRLDKIMHLLAARRWRQDQPVLGIPGLPTLDQVRLKETGDGPTDLRPVHFECHADLRRALVHERRAEADGTG
jgi:hypothetical protein